MLEACEASVALNSEVIQARKTVLYLLTNFQISK